MDSSDSVRNWWEPTVRLGCFIPTGLLVLGVATGRIVFYVLFGLSLFVGVPAVVVGLIGRLSHRKPSSRQAVAQHCFTCGKAMAFGSTVCAACTGVKTVAGPVCRSCFGPLDFSAAFCPNCGAPAADVSE